MASLIVRGGEHHPMSAPSASMASVTSVAFFVLELLPQGLMAGCVPVRREPHSAQEILEAENAFCGIYFQVSRPWHLRAIAASCPALVKPGLKTS